MSFEHILVERSGDFATVTMNRPQRRNALSLEHMRELITAFGELGNSDVLGIVLAGNGPVFSAGHDFADTAGADLPYMRALLSTCTDLMNLIQHVPSASLFPSSPNAVISSRMCSKDRALRRRGRFIVTVAKSPERSTRMCSKPITLR